MTIDRARETAEKIKQQNLQRKLEDSSKGPEPFKPNNLPAPLAKTFGSFTIRKAERSLARLRVGLAGPSGSGKTYSALLMAHGMAEWEEILIIDTENGSADLYSNLGPYNVITLEKPYSAERYINALKAAEDAGMKVIIIDSITHEWNGQGGILELQEKLGGTFRDWAKVTPVHNKFVQTILQSKAHIITTVRSKTDYAMTTEGGKSKVEKVGMKPETREGYEYEMTISLDLNINNMATVSKDRTDLYKNNAPFVITEDTGRELLEWANKGINYLEKIDELLALKGKTVDPILATFKIFSLEELSVAQYKAIISKLEAMPDYVAPKPEKNGPKKKDQPMDGEINEEGGEVHA